MQRTLKEPSGVLLGTLWLYLYSMPVCDDKLVSVVIVSMTAFELFVINNLYVKKNI